jgi:hypothetical protein
MYYYSLQIKMGFKTKKNKKKIHCFLADLAENTNPLLNLAKHNGQSICWLRGRYLETAAYITI